MLFSPALSPPVSMQLSHTALSLFLSQDRAIVADRRRVGTINRYWTNYKADVPLYDGGRTLSRRRGSVVLSLSLWALVLCCFTLHLWVSLWLSLLWLLLPSFITFLIIHLLHYYFFLRNTKQCFFVLAVNYVKTWLHARTYIGAHVYDCSHVLSQPF